jgi:beta-galactosidase
VEIRALDAKGVWVAPAAVPCTVTVSGSGTLAGLDNGDQNDMTRLTDPSRKLHHGRALALVRSSRSPGPITVTVSSAALPETHLTLHGE